MKETTAGYNTYEFSAENEMFQRFNEVNKKQNKKYALANTILFACAHQTNETYVIFSVFQV